MKRPRKLDARPPRDGITGVPKDALTELVKVLCFGFCETPRLRWLQLREHILAAGFVESRFSPATCEFYDKKSDLCGVLNVRVNDSLLAGGGDPVGNRTHDHKMPCGGVDH